MKMNIRLRPDADVRAETIKIGKMSALVVRPKEPMPDAPGVLWIHGGGLTAALCMFARDKGTVRVAFQMPLYPMLDNLDTESSRDNHGRVWNTRRNHFGWRMYLRGNAKKKVSPYAAAGQYFAEN